MSNKITSLLFYDAFTGIGGGGVPYFNGDVLDEIGGVIYFETAWNFTEARFIFSATYKTITLNNPVDPRTFKLQEFIISDSITVVDTASNDGNYTITDISDDGLMVTVAESLVDEENYSCSIHGVTKITGLDFRFNIIKNGAQENYTSLTDNKTKQIFTASGLDATDTTTAIPMVVATKSSSWVSNKITDSNAGSTTEVTIKGNGISDYRQKFKITQKINYTSPVYLNGLYPNFINTITPDLYSDGGLKYICSIATKFDENSPVINHTGSVNSQEGSNTWFDEKREYYVDSVSYQDNDTSEMLSVVDVNKNIAVTIVIKSRSGKFADGGVEDGTKMQINFSACPSSESDYVNTETTLIQNQFIDSAFTELGASAVNGINFGTAYQAITGLEITFNSVNQCTAVFIFSAGDTLKSYWQSKTDGDRFYELSAITQDILITQTGKSDRATLLADFKSADWDKSDNALSGFTGTGIEYFEFPDTGNTPVGNIDCMEGDIGFVKIGFYIDSTVTDDVSPTLKDCSFEIVAIKSGDEFIFESTSVSLKDFPKVLGIQEVDFSDTRGFISYEDDPCNSVIVQRDPDNDSTNRPAYVAQYGIAIRYEAWINALTQFQMFGTDNSEIIKSFASVTQRWSDYSSAEGWNFYFRFKWTVTGSSGFDNLYSAKIPIIINATNQNLWPSGSGLSAPDMKYYSWDMVLEEEIEQIDSIDIDGPVKAKATFTGNYSLPVDGNGWHGFIFISPDNGGVFDRRIASSEIPSESDSPWSAPPEDIDADYSIANGNARINIYLNDGDPSDVVKIIVESIFDSSLYDALVTDTFPQARLGVIYNSTVS